MKKPKSKTKQPWEIEDWERHVKPLPVGKEDIEEARSYLEQFNEAVLDGDVTASHTAIKAYDDLVIRLNGGTHFGSYSSDQRPGPILRKALVAKDGEYPIWGQPGVMFVHVLGMPAIVSYAGNSTSLTGHFEFRAAAVGQMFISETGYLSHFIQRDPAKCFPGKTVKQAVEAMLHDIQLGERKRHHKISLEEMKFNHYYQQDWVLRGLAEMRDGYPRAGQHVRLKTNGRQQVGLVVDLPHCNVPPGNIMVALLTGKSTARSVPAISIGVVPVSHVMVMPNEELIKEADLGCYLTPAMVDAFLATQAIFSSENEQIVGQ
ncbi:hypothetical protein ACFFU8_08970 [Chromobacterium piscinae]|uniref:hypothetical protein n=1 Tax=Chromobacterium piscinae TaxID=686831 RepID=UPI001E5978DD|nr:hypothetical protein [Chromobacterium piscinae]MCD5327965.1 hypothetical protein [Chromobacterium piscinae]